MRYSLIDLMNLARTRLILGSGWSSYSEVAAYWGGEGGKPVPILMAGRDFGLMVDAPPTGVLAAPPRKPATDADFAPTAERQLDPEEEEGRFVTAKDDGADTLQRNWPKPFGNW